MAFKNILFAASLVVFGLASRAQALEIALYVTDAKPAATLTVTATEQAFSALDGAQWLLNDVKTKQGKDAPVEWSIKDGALERVGTLGPGSTTDGATTLYYGWCYAVDGKRPEVSAATYKLDASRKTLAWYYGAVVVKDGKGTQCMPFSSGVALQD